MDIHEMEADRGGRVSGVWAPGQGGRLAPPGFEPQPIRQGGYVDRHPTRYFWRPDIAELVRACYRLFGGPQQLHLNSYEEHPPNPDAGNRALWLGLQTESLSLDGWGPEGRGDAMPAGLHDDLFDFLFNYEHGPDVWWAITKGGMWVRARNPLRGFGFWLDSPPGAPDSDPRHDNHPHLTFLSMAEQFILRPSYTIEEGIELAREVGR